MSDDPDGAASGDDTRPSVAADSADAPPWEDAQEALDHIDLVNVLPTRIRAEVQDNPNPCTDVGYSVGVQFATAAGVFSNRFHYEIELRDAEGQSTAILEFELQVDYEVDGNFELGQEAADFLTRTTGLFAAYPYARELAQSLTARLQQDPLVLGLMPRGAVGPARVTGGGNTARVPATERAED